MNFVTTACGERHRGLAKGLWESWQRWGWPRLTVVSDAPIEGITGNIVAPAGMLWGGRGMKTRFADYLPDDAGGVVAFVDADCEVVGPFTGLLEVPKGAMAGASHKAFRRMRGIDHFLCSALLVFHDLEDARNVCARWHAELVSSGHESRDELALFAVSMDFKKIPHGTVSTPLANLHHALATTSIRAAGAGGLPGWFDFADIYRQAVECAPRGGVLVEVGVWRGKSLAFLGGHAAASGKSLTVIGYDQFLPEYYLGAPALGLTSDGWLDLVRADMRRLVPQDTPEVVRANSAEAAGLHADGSVHFVFLDAGHTEADLLADLWAWLPKIAPGGIIAGHDLDHPKHPGVRAALEKSGLAWEPASRSSWIARTAVTGQEMRF